MATDIDTLQIQINAQATKANDAIDRLVGKLDRLTGSLSNFGANSSALTSLASGVQQLGTAMQTMNTVKTADFTRLAKNLTALSNVDAAKIGKLALNITNIGKSLDSLSNVPNGASQLVELANGIKQLGYKSASQAIQNIPQLAKAMKQLMLELSSAPRVSKNLIDMTNALANFTKACSGINKISSPFQPYTKSAKKAKVHTFSLASAIGKVYATYWMLFRAMGQIRKSINLSSDLTEVQNVVDVTFGEMAYKVGKFAKTSIESFGMSELTVKNISSRFQAMGMAMGFPLEKMSDMSMELTRLTADMASFYNIEQKAVAEDLESIFTGQTRPLRAYGLDLTEATLKEWALKNGLNANMKAMTQAEKTMLRYQYVLANTGAAQGDYARTADTWHNSVTRLKQGFEELGITLGGAFINWLKPVVSALNVVIGKLNEFAVAVSNSLGKIFGWKYEPNGGVKNDIESGADAADDLASGMGAAADNAKKLKDYTLGIDELNVINPKDNSSGGSGGGGGTDLDAGAYGDGGKWIKDKSLLEYESELDTLYKLGEYIGERLQNALENIDWKSIYEKARGFGTGLADFLNGLISPELFGEIGSSIASALNTALHVIDSFGETFDWRDFGESIASGINKFFATFDFKLLAKTINKWVKGIFTTIATAVKKIKWSTILKGIGSFAQELDISTITLLTVLNIKKIGDAYLALSKTIGGVTALLTTIGGAFVGNADDVARLSTQYPRLSKAVDVLGDSFQRLMFGIHYGDWANGIISALTNIRNNLTGLQKAGITAISGFAEFKVVKSSVEELAMGSQNVVLELGKIGAAAGIAAAAMYTALGPAGLAVAGITAAVAALSGISEAEKKMIEQSEIDRYGDTLENVLDNIHETAEAIRERSDAAKEYLEDVGVAEMTMAQDLADQYFELAEKENLTNEEKEEMKNISKNLVDLFPEIKEFYNEETGLIDGTRDAVDKLIESKLQEIKLAAAQEVLKKAYEEQLNAEKALKDAIENAKKAQEDMNAASSAYQDIMRKMELKTQYQTLSDQINTAYGDTDELIQKQQELWAELTDNGENKDYVYKDFTNELMNAGEELQRFSGEFEEAKKALADMSGTYEGVQSDIDNLTEMLKTGMTDAGAFAGEGLANGFESNRNLSEEAARLLGTNAINATEDALETHSPSKVYEQIGAYAVEGFNLGISENAQTTVDAVNAWIGSVSQTVSSASWSGMFDGMLAGFKDKWTELTTWWQATAAPTFFSSHVSKWFSADKWKKEADGMKVGLTDKWNEFVNKWKRDVSSWWDSNVQTWFTEEKWSEQGEHFKTALVNKWEEFNSKWSELIALWWSEQVEPWFETEKWEIFGENMKNGIYSGLEGIIEKASRLMNSMIDVFNAGLLKIKDAMNDLIGSYNEIAGEMDEERLPKISFSRITHVDIPAYEIGGFPEDGLFMANHTELVGQFSNGKTAVANNEQIIAGIRQGVYEANSEQDGLIREMIGLLQDIRAKNTVIKMNGKEVGRGLNNSARRQGYTLRTSY